MKKKNYIHPSLRYIHISPCTLLAASSNRVSIDHGRLMPTKSRSSTLFGTTEIRFRKNDIFEDWIRMSDTEESGRGKFIFYR